MSRRSATALTALLGSALLSGCGTGLEALAYKETGRQDHVGANLGGRAGIAIRNVHISSPRSGSVLTSGGSAYVVGALVNNGTEADALVGAASDVATSTVLLLESAPVTSIPVTALGTAGTRWQVELRGLVRDLRVGQYVPVTFSFARGGRITLQVPVTPGDTDLEHRETAQDPYSLHEGGAEGAGHGAEDGVGQGGVAEPTASPHASPEATSGAGAEPTASPTASEGGH